MSQQIRRPTSLAWDCPKVVVKRVVSLSGSVVELKLLNLKWWFHNRLCRVHVPLSALLSVHLLLPTFHGPTTVPSFPAEYNPGMYGYPYQSPTHFSTPPTNPNPFHLKFVTGNIRICQGCRGSLRCADSTIPEPPHNICIARAEKRPYRDSSGSLITPTTYKPSHYHVALTCIQAVEPGFVPHSLKVPTDVQNQLSPDHNNFIWMQMGIWI